jgi:mannose-6-phosphate isomerase-like protein (cupin superfamily)
MSYPAAKYSGTKGQVNAELRRAGHEPEISYNRGGTVHYLATGAATDGEFGLYLCNWGPAAGGPDAHFHKTITESFFILDGVVRLYDGKSWVDAEAGDFLRVPQGGIHAFRNESGETASMLLLFTPGAPREEYFEWLDEIGKGLRTLTEDERAEFMLRHDTFWV